MIFEKFNEEELFGISVFLFNTNLAIDVFIRLNKNNYRENASFYSRVNRISIKVNYNDIDKTLIYFEEKDKNDNYYLMDKISLKRFVHKGNILIFTPFLSPMSFYNEDNVQKISKEFSKLNNEDFINPEKIDYKEIFKSYLKNTLRVKDNEIVRFSEFDNQKE